MEAIALQVALLRAQAPELTLRTGQTMVARVVAQQGGAGTITLAGATLAAQLPSSVAAGETLRLRVEEVGPERVVLRNLDQAPPPVAVALPLPGQVEVAVDPDGQAAGEGGSDSTEAVSLVFDTPELGRMHLALERRPEGVRVEVTARAGQSVQRAREGAGELERALAIAVGEPTTVVVVERREPLDVYA